MRKLSRRDLLKGIAASGLLLALDADATNAHARGPFRPSVFLAVAADDLVSIVSHRAEMGQGIRATLVAAVADEMGADLAHVRVVQAEGDEKKYGDQNTDGSHSVRSFLTQMREIGATARWMLEEAAARQWSVDHTEVETRIHQVVHRATGRALRFGALAEAAQWGIPVPKREQLRLKSQKELRFIGKDVPFADAAAMSAGQAHYGADVVLPGMKFAAIARPPVYGGAVASSNERAALATPGVERVLRLPQPDLPSGMRPVGGIAVLARHTWAAIQGRDALDVQWSGGPHAAYDSAAYRNDLLASVRSPGLVVREEGHVDAALTAAKRVVEAEYYVPHLAHAPMEPPVAVARATADSCEVWAPTQDPDGARRELGHALGLKEEQVTVHVTLLGGAFGRKAKHDFVLEAALLSRAAGAPVRVQWTRDDDMRHGYYHAVAAHRLRAGLDEGGRVTAWLHRAAFPSIISTFAKGVDHAESFELAQGMVNVPFAIPNLRCENGAAPGHVRIGWFRSVHNIHHAFAIQSFAAELAATAGRDPKDFLLELIGPPRRVDLSHVPKASNLGAEFSTEPHDTARLRRVIEVAAAKAGWGRKLPPRHGLGIAAHRSFLSYVATVVQVAVDANGQVSVPRVETAFDCGFAANPDRVRAQAEGAAVMGMSLAAYGAITFKNGQVEQENFSDFQVVRMDAAPRQIGVHLIDGGPPIGGVGEAGLPPFAPALCNAIFAATGRRIRELPVGGHLRG